MPTTGSRKITPLRLIAGAMLLLAALGLVTALAGQVQAGAADTVVVNSTGDDDDGDCEGPPNNNVIGGDCTLREAIEAVNDGLADTIKFHPPVFPKENPGVINIEDAGGGGDCLPAIERDGVTIDSEASGVVIDGDRDDDPTNGPDCPGDSGAIQVEGTNNGFDFTVLGGKNLTIREWGGDEDDGIRVDGDESPCGPGDCSFGDVLITGVIIEDVEDDGITVTDTRNIRNVVITNSDIRSSYPELDSDNAGEQAIDIHASAFGDDDEIFDDDSNVTITGNQLFGQEDGVTVEYDGDLGNPDSGQTNKISVNVSENDNIDADEDGDEGVEIDFDTCIFKSAVNVDVNGNGRINGGDGDGVQVDLDADGSCYSQNINGGPVDDSQRATFDVSVNDNGVIEVTGDDGAEGVDIEANICCGESEHDVTITVDGNDDIIGDGQGVRVDLGDEGRICCGDDNVSAVSVSGNGEITGENNFGVAVEVRAGETEDDDDSDGNISTVVVNDNDEVTGVGSDAIFVANFVGAFGTGSGDDNVAEIEVSGNRRIDGDDDGLALDAVAGSDDGEADDNLARITVADNEQVDGGQSDGAQLIVQAGSRSFEDGAAAAEGDDNTTEVLIQGNDRFAGNGGDGFRVRAFAGGDTTGSERNTNNITVVENGDIEGEGSGNDGINLESNVCCSARKSNVNNITISDNLGDIIGHDGDGIDLEDICCTVSHNVVTIADNTGIIRGGDEAGIDYQVDTEAIVGELNENDLEGDLLSDGLFDTVNLLTISGNTLDGSGEDGIEICCGAFEEADQGKSVISENVIRHNADHGIEIDSSFGLNIGPNNIITENGDDDSVDGGVEIDNSASVHIPDLQNPGVGNDVVPANHNTITQNSIFDNTGLGIDLAADTDEDGGGPEADALDHDDDGNSEEDHGVGCEPKDGPINPNDCIPHPTLQTQAGNKLIGHACSLCTVELFWADDTPEDQTGGPEDQHEGEEHGEGVEYIVSGTAAADGDFSIQLPCGLGAGELTATATDKVKNTSEFAANQPTLGTSACATPTFTPTNTVPPTNTPLPTNTFTPAPPTNTPLPTATPTPAKDCGDVDDSGAVNSIDAQLILQLKAGLLASLPNEASADVNADGDITSVDALLILQLDAGLIDALNCG